MAANREAFKKLILRPLRFRVFLATQLPAAWLAGVRVESFTDEQSVVSVRYKWFNKNPFRSVYFGVLSIAAEISTGIPAMACIYKSRPAVSMLIVQNEGSFLKKATGRITFTCNDGQAVAQTIANAIATGEPQSFTCLSEAHNSAGELVASFRFTWSFKAKK